MKIYTYRFAWRLKDSDKVNIKVLTDTLDGLENFASYLKTLDGVEMACREYVSEFDFEKFGFVDNLLEEVKKDETF